MTKKGSTFNTYSEELKLSAVQSYLNGEGSYNMIKEKYQLRSSTQLKNWVKKYKECGEITDTRGENNKMKGKKVLKLNNRQPLTIKNTKNTKVNNFTS